MLLMLVQCTGNQATLPLPLHTQHSEACASFPAHLRLRGGRASGHPLGVTADRDADSGAAQSSPAGTARTTTCVTPCWECGSASLGKHQFGSSPSHASPAQGWGAPAAPPEELAAAVVHCRPGTMQRLPPAGSSAPAGCPAAQVQGPPGEWWCWAAAGCAGQSMPAAGYRPRLLGQHALVLRQGIVPSLPAGCAQDLDPPACWSSAASAPLPQQAM